MEPMLKTYASVLPALLIAMLAGCSSAPSPAVDGAIRKSLNQAGLKDISVSQDRHNGVVTLSGKVPSDDAKSQAEAIAKGLANGQVVADQIAVIPPNNPGDTKTLYADLDKGIQSNLDAALIQNKIPGTIRHSTNNGVVTLSGTVVSEDARAQAQQVASAVPNVQQVVNELQVKDQKATSTN
jgi:hyperosmotically inducible protein